MKATPIPQRSRDLVKARDRFRCVRCLVPAPNGHWHHRRTRLVRDEHQHCPCNGVWLCPACHAWVHQHPAEAREAGLIVYRSVSEPATVPVTTPLGLRVHDCGGEWRSA